MDTGKISEQMLGGHLPKDCQVYSFSNGIEFRNGVGVERGIINFVIPSSSDVRCSLLNERHSYMKPTTHRKVPNQFVT